MSKAQPKAKTVKAGSVKKAKAATASKVATVNKVKGDSIVAKLNEKKEAEAKQTSAQRGRPAKTLNDSRVQLIDLMYERLGLNRRGAVVRTEDSIGRHRGYEYFATSVFRQQGSDNLLSAAISSEDGEFKVVFRYLNKDNAMIDQTIISDKVAEGVVTQMLNQRNVWDKQAAEEAAKAKAADKTPAKAGK